MGRPDIARAPAGGRPAVAAPSSARRGWLRALLRRRRLLAVGLLAYVILLVGGTAAHEAHHGTKPGLAPVCPVLSAAEQLPWTPAERPQVVPRLAGWTPAAPTPAPVGQPGRPPGRERDRAPPLLAPAV